MNEIEAHSLIVDLLQVAHDHGEAVWGRLDLWAGVSSGLIIMAYFAPERLNKPLTSLVLGLYAAMTAVVFFNVRADLASSDALVSDATAVAASFGIEMESLLLKTTSTTSDIFQLAAMAIFFVGLFLGTNGYLLYTCFSNYNKQTTENDENSSTL